MVPFENNCIKLNVALAKDNVLGNGIVIVGVPRSMQAGCSGLMLGAPGSVRGKKPHKVSTFCPCPNTC